MILSTVTDGISILIFFPCALSPTPRLLPSCCIANPEPNTIRTQLASVYKLNDALTLRNSIEYVF